MPSVIDRINADHIANQAAHLAGEKLAGLMKRYADARHVLDLANNPDPYYAGVATRFAVEDRLAEVKRYIKEHGKESALAYFATIVEDAEEGAVRKTRD
ncbi:MAG: hypothetical protein WA049_20395 [Ferribacterium limneticum]